MAEQTAPQSGQGEATPPATEGQTTGEQSAAQSQEVAPSRDDRTPEDVEAYWKNRQSSEAAAFAAKEKALRDEIAALSSRVKDSEVKAATKDAADQTEVERLRQLNQSLTEQLEQTQKAAVAETRKAKYPNAAENLEDGILVSMDEANLAALNEKLKVNISGGTNTRIDANQPPRSQPGASKPSSEKTAEELKADLASMSEAFAASLKG